MARKKGVTDDPVLTRKLVSGGFVTYQDRLAASKIYESNNFNLDKTANMLGVHKDQILKWHKQVKGNAIAEVAREKEEFAIEARAVTERAMAVKESEFVNLAHKVKESAIQRMKDLIPESESIRDLATVVKVMHEVTTGAILSEEEKNGIDSKPKSILMQIANLQINTINTTEKEDNGQE